MPDVLSVLPRDLRLTGYTIRVGEQHPNHTRDAERRGPMVYVKLLIRRRGVDHGPLKEEPSSLTQG
jgi:hypothetical protein